MVNLAQVCERYGGGDMRAWRHQLPARPGRCSRAAAKEIVAELRAKDPR